MEVFAKGKNIPTYSFGNLFIQGEKLADTVTVSVERYYNDTDISGYTFVIVGLTEEDWEVSQLLAYKETDDKYIRLKWNVSSDFTINAGKLRLELRAVEETDGEATTIIKYDMPPVYVKPTINGKNEPPPETGQQFINSITVITAECLEMLQNHTNNVKVDLQDNMNSFRVEIQDSLNDFNMWVQNKLNSFKLDETKERLDNMEADTAVYLARPEVIPVTRSQYNEIQHKKNALYVITGEE